MKAPHCRVLLVEDDRDDQLFFKLAVKALDSDAVLHIVPDGTEALRYLKGEGQYADRVRFCFPTMLVTDLKMPFCDGFQLLRTIRSDKRWFVIPIVVLSSSGDNNDILSAYAAGANSYFVKPSDPQLLRDLVRRLHDYWKEAELPDMDQAGVLRATISHGKLGQAAQC